MKELSIKESKNTYAGAGITSTFINALSRGLNVFTDLGRYLGSSIRRMIDNNFCDY